ncbi:hypothetical protein AAE478_006166 [Parahypoxylon ruwenzoriense]
MDVNNRQWQMLEESQRCLPRFLFRGFHSSSGGGDRRLNNNTGVTPHGFLRERVPKTIRDIPRMRDMIIGHLGGLRIPSCFSSWAADLNVAIRYSRNSNIAIVDTNLLADRVKIYHVKAFYAAGLANYAYDHEYLAFGPITGPAYRCARYVDIKNTVEISSASLITVRVFSSADVLRLISRCSKAASLFYPSGIQPDVAIALTAIFLCLYPDAISRVNTEHLVTNMLYFFAGDLQTLVLPAPGSGDIKIVFQDGSQGSFFQDVGSWFLSEMHNNRGIHSRDGHAADEVAG